MKVQSARGPGGSKLDIGLATGARGPSWAWTSSSQDGSGHGPRGSDFLQGRTPSDATAIWRLAIRGKRQARGGRLAAVDHSRRMGARRRWTSQRAIVVPKACLGPWRRAIRCAARRRFKPQEQGQQRTPAQRLREGDTNSDRDRAAMLAAAERSTAERPGANVGAMNGRTPWTWMQRAGCWPQQRSRPARPHLRDVVGVGVVDEALGVTTATRVQCRRNSPRIPDTARSLMCACWQEKACDGERRRQRARQRCRLQKRARVHSLHKLRRHLSSSKAPVARRISALATCRLGRATSSSPPIGGARRRSSHGQEVGAAVHVLCNGAGLHHTAPPRAPGAFQSVPNASAQCHASPPQSLIDTAANRRAPVPRARSPSPARQRECNAAPPPNRRCEGLEKASGVWTAAPRARFGRVAELEWPRIDAIAACIMACVPVPVLSEPASEILIFTRTCLLARRGSGRVDPYAPARLCTTGAEISVACLRCRRASSLRLYRRWHRSEVEQLVRALSAEVTLHVQRQGMV
ncbi:hypothetical protein PSPO01_06534 [Paraphaeosphaeria sporulosa]